MTTFRKELARIIDASAGRLSQRELGRRLRHGGNGLVELVLKGPFPVGRNVPLEKLEDWLDALELVGKEKEKERALLRFLAIRDYAPDYVKEIIAERDRLKRDHADVTEMLSITNERVAQLEKRLRDIEQRD